MNCPLCKKTLLKSYGENIVVYYECSVKRFLNYKNSRILRSHFTMSVNFFTAHIKQYFLEFKVKDKKLTIYNENWQSLVSLFLNKKDYFRLIKLDHLILEEKIKKYLIFS